METPKLKGGRGQKVGSSAWIRTCTDLSGLWTRGPNDFQEIVSTFAPRVNSKPSPQRFAPLETFKN